MYLVILVYSQDVNKSFAESGFNHSVFFERVEDNHSSDIVIRWFSSVSKVVSFTIQSIRNRVGLRGVF